MYTLDGKVAVILGASTGGGIGAAIARAFTQSGARVVLAARRLEGLEEVAREVGGTAVRCDITKEAEIEALAAKASALHGSLDIAVNVAGAHASEALDSITPETMARVFEINVVGPALFIKHCARHMTAGGSIIVVSSHSAQLSSPGVAPYACSKAAVERLVEIAALEYGPHGIRVNTLSPGMLSTPMSDAMLNRPGMRKVFERETPLGRLATVEDVAAGALYLAGDRCWTTGDRIRVGGGIHLRRFPQADDFPPP